MHEGGTDPRLALLAIVAVGYMVSRGLAKSGSRDSYRADSSDLPETDDGRDAPLARGLDS
jgi:hypothetical protein